MAGVPSERWNKNACICPRKETNSTAINTNNPITNMDGSCIVGHVINQGFRLKAESLCFKILNQRTFFTQNRISLSWILEEWSPCPPWRGVLHQRNWHNYFPFMSVYGKKKKKKKKLTVTLEPRRLKNNENIDCLSWLKICLDTFLFWFWNSLVIIGKPI